ncbi:His-Xaa-Ser system radical SAM maturase HxsB [Pseudoxanthomonas yeongjuensis]|uniref:His-Xaa-Ser system radical SAM maturase HxsB n=1 Tax=Pseudoxanthomonas yeongjuensis TaxID=377616 RepID=UPI0013911C6A|nr:His-Xaa-Ser system radical SAM maturase HxsB [Pseudoxanthomonas yeongjuensis]KAF1717920.1 His-Xaa-Ser system radical SAM maturase HxsB [Pseudoxanthomonas yeongjuensis]
MMKFADKESFQGAGGYHLLPLRFRRLPWDQERVFVSSMSGDWSVMLRSDLDRAVGGDLQPSESLFADMEARNLISTDPDRSTLAPLLSQYRTRKAYLQSGPALHIFVVSLRCHHTCSYCQVSRQPTSKSEFDMSGLAAGHAVDRLFEWPSEQLTIEFQGGEPLLHFDRVKSLVGMIEARNKTEGRSLRFVLASTLHDLSEEQLAFLKDHQFQLSTSLDGPEWLHNANRPRLERDSYKRTVEGIGRGRRALGDDAVSALTTLTSRSLQVPTDIIDEYRKLGFHSISLRPLSPYGFARKTAVRNGYGISDFLRFYEVALGHILAVNRQGYAMEETYGSLLLSQLLTPFSHGYVDLRSPTGAGLGTVVYDYDGQVYPSDEARMLAAMGDDTFSMGRVDQPVSTWLTSPAMKAVIEAGVAEALPGCSDCAYVPLCGADPIDHYARQGNCIGHRPTSDFCRKQMGLFDLLLEKLETLSSSDRTTLESWVFRSHQTASDMKEVA